MSKIKIPFNEWSKGRLWMKTCTSRNKKYGKVGDTFTVYFNKFHPYKIIYKITHIEKLSLGFVADCLYSLEGAWTPIEFIKVWEDIHPIIGFVPEQKVWVHVFKEIKKEEM